MIRAGVIMESTTGEGVSKDLILAARADSVLPPALVRITKGIL